MPNSPLLPLLRRTYWLSVVAILLTAGTVATVALMQRHRERWTQHSRDVVRMARRAQSLARDRETSVRGFLLTGDSTSLAPDRAAGESLRANLDSLIAATADNPAQRRRAQAYAAAITRWDTAFAQRALTRRSQSGSSANAWTTLDRRDAFAGKLLFDDVRTRYLEIEEEEEALYRSRSDATIRLQTLDVLVTMVGLVMLALAQGALRRRVSVQAVALVERQEQLEQQAIALEEQATELEEQTAELEAQTEELQDTVKELGRKNEELDAFSSSVAHDLRSPLRSIDGFSHLLLSDYASVLDASGVSALNRIRANTQRMGELIDGLLTLARVSAGELRAVEVNLSELADATAQELGRTLGLEGSVELLIQPNLAARGDGRLIRVVLQNLLENAFKFTRAVPQPRVEVGSKLVDGHHSYFVADNGIGFDMRYAGKLFGPFERLHDDPEYKGTGIGLATVRRIVQRHDGRVWAESEPGRGATFYFTLGI